MLPLISIITPVYRAEKYINKCISSVLSQKYKNFELLLINDGSPDNSGVICEEYANHDSRIKVYHKENRGVSSARNYGLNIAKGEFVLFLDSDDYLSHDALMFCEMSMRKESLDILQFSIQGVTSNGTLTNKTTIKRKTTVIMSPEEYIRCGQLQVCAGGTCIRRNIIENNKIRFNNDMRLAEDQLFILSCIMSSKKIKFENTILYYYLDNPNSATHINKSVDIILSVKYLQEYIIKYPLSSFLLNKQIINFICLLLRNGDVEYKELSALITNKNFLYSNKLRTSEKLFVILSNISFRFACYVTKLLFNMHDSCIQKKASYE